MNTVVIILFLSLLLTIVFLLPVITSKIKPPPDSSNWDIVVFSLYRTLLVSIGAVMLWAIIVFAYTYFFE